MSDAEPRVITWPEPVAEYDLPFIGWSEWERRAGRKAEIPPSDARRTARAVAEGAAASGRRRWLAGATDPIPGQRAVSEGAAAPTTPAAGGASPLLSGARPGFGPPSRASPAEFVRPW